MNTEHPILNCSSLIGVTTASAEQRPNNELNLNSNNNNIKPGFNHYVGVQSRFQRKYYHKGLVVILIFLLSLITTALIMSLYFGKKKQLFACSFLVAVIVQILIFQVEIQILYVKRKTVCGPHQIYYKVWTLQ